MIHQSLLLFFVTFSASAPYVAAILLAIISCWAVAIRLLGVEFNALTAETGVTRVSAIEQNEDERLVSGDVVLAEQQAV